MADRRTLSDKVNDIKTTYAIFQELVTPPQMQEVMDDMTGAQRQAGAATGGDVQAYAALVQASIQLRRIVAANDRAALLAAVMANQSGVSRPQLDVSDDPEG